MAIATEEIFRRRGPAAAGRQVEVNGGALDVVAPFGGFGQSGYSRELGVHGLEEYLEMSRCSSQSPV